MYKIDRLLFIAGIASIIMLVGPYFGVNIFTLCEELLAPVQHPQNTIEDEAPPSELDKLLERE